MPPFNPIFACLDPDAYSEYGSRSRKLLNTDPDPQHYEIKIRNGINSSTFHRDWKGAMCDSTVLIYLVIRTGGEQLARLIPLQTVNTASMTWILNSVVDPDPAKYETADK